jgi:mRNA interferase RelE/StbE
LDRRTQATILRFLRERVESAEDPRRLAKPLHGEKRGLWRFRVGDYRLICDVRAADTTVHVLAVGHRKEIYR